MKTVENIGETKFPTKSIVVLVLGVLLLFGLIASVKIIPTGHAGVRHLFGKVYSDEPLSEGFHLINPLAKVAKYSIRTEEYTMVSAIGEGAVTEADTISAKTIENTEVGLDITVLYHLEKKALIGIWREVGHQENVVAKLIRPPIRTRVRDIVALYTKDEVNKQRPKIAQEIRVSIEENVAKRGIVIEEVFLRDIKFPRKVQEAINEKEAEKEAAAKMQFTIEKERREKERKIVEAQGISEANKIIAKSLTREYLTWYWINGLENYQSVAYVPIGDNGMPIFKDVDSIMD